VFSSLKQDEKEKYSLIFAEKKKEEQTNTKEKRKQ
jgi:hypothetical protein